MTRDMTEGRPFRLIFAFSLPLIFGNLFQQMYNMVDTIIVGKILGLNALTAVGSTSSLNFLILGFCLGTCSGLSIPVAQRFGARNFGQMRMFVANAAYISLLLALVMMLATTVFCDDILCLMQTPDEIFNDAYSYFFVICLGIPFSVLYNTASGIIRALGDSKTPFYFLLMSTILNVVLDLVFIIVLKLGVAGAAWATIVSQAAAGIICFFYMQKKFVVLKMSDDEKRVRLPYIRELLLNSIPMGLQSSITAIGSIMLQSAVNSLDVLYVSAFAAANKVKQLAMCPYEAVASACATFGGQNLGAGKIRRIKKGLFCGIGICFVYSVAIGIVLVLAGSKIALLFVDGQETQVLSQVQTYLTCTGFFYWLLAILNCTRMTIQGLGHSGIAVFAGCSELLARGMMSLFVIPVVGYMGVCFTDQTAWIAATLVVVPVFFSIMKKLQAKTDRIETAKK